MEKLNTPDIPEHLKPLRGEILDELQAHRETGVLDDLDAMMEVIANDPTQLQQYADALAS